MGRQPLHAIDRGNPARLWAESRPLPPAAYQPSAAEVAPTLLGHWLLRRLPGGVAGGRIVEVEAYLRDDPASHAFRGPTPRNRSMFGPPGLAYVYLIYGLHHCVNAVCGPAGVGEAVLIRALEPGVGLARMARRRKQPGPGNLTDGPGKLCVALDIDRQLDGANLCDPQGELWIAMAEDRESFVNDRGGIEVTPRIGITQGAELPLRFVLKASHGPSRAIGRKRGRRRGTRVS